MNKRAVCIEDRYLFKELPFKDRFAAAKAAGFDSVEFWSWRELDPDAVGRWAAEAGIEVSGFIGADKGSAIDPDDHELYLRGVAESLDAARRMRATSIYIFSDEIGPGGVVRRVSPALTREEKVASLVRTIGAAADLAAKAGVGLILEPVNSVYVKGYFLDTVAETVKVMKAVGRPEVKMVYDFYHQQLVAGNLIQNLRPALPHVGSIHVADVPGRVEPGLGEINFANLAKEMETLGYRGTILFECNPKTSTLEALRAIETYFPKREI
ncbi:MAG TPA: TIM barrel protein [Bacillota bacterium]|jgi:hydroxypyruvate isomerase